MAYAVDAFERGVLFMDTLRERRATATPNTCVPASRLC
jgi:hypothetical protein